MQPVDALEVYNQRKNGELVLHSEKSLKTAAFSPKAVSNYVISFTLELFVQEQLKKKPNQTALKRVYSKCTFGKLCKFLVGFEVLCATELQLVV